MSSQAARYKVAIQGDPTATHWITASRLIEYLKLILAKDDTERITIQRKQPEAIITITRAHG